VYFIRADSPAKPAGALSMAKMTPLFWKNMFITGGFSNYYYNSPSFLLLVTFIYILFHFTLKNMD
jgi:hypothetical protein